MLVWLISSSRSRSVTEPPLSNTYTRTHTHTHICVGEIHFSGSVFIYFSSANFPLSVLTLNGVAVDYRIPVRAEGKGGMNRNNGYVLLINIIVFIFNGFSEFDRE